jgi:hypothetical protein
MKEQATIPKTHPRRGEQGLRKASASLSDGRKLEVEGGATREEAITSATREWIIPALVRRFLAEQSSDRGAVGGREASSSNHPEGAKGRSG